VKKPRSKKPHLIEAEKARAKNQYKKRTKPKPQPLKNQKDEEGSIRLNRLIARYGLCSRRKADEWIEEGRVAINGICCKQVGISIKPEEHSITIDGQLLGNPPDLVYLAFHKPKGVVTTKYDPQGRTTVMDLIPKEHSKAGVFPVGRLDRDSEGLILLTNDGEWSKKLQHPRHQVWKKYYVETDAPLNPEQKAKLEKGLMMDSKRTLPARVHPKHKQGKMSKQFMMEIREGRNRQIRRMCKKVGLQVKSLMRIAVGTISLGQLKPGETRRLSKQEIAAIFDMQERKVFPQKVEAKP
jgi:pseudouridine synthase